jgi:hypothetical protein
MVPNGAWCRTAHGAERRMVPNGGEVSQLRSEFNIFTITTNRLRIGQ